MSSYDQIDDEEELHKLMNSTESFDDRKKIRARLREIREKQRAEMEARRQQREKETEDLVRKKFALAEEEKKRKMEAYSHQKATCDRDTEYHSASQKLVKDKLKAADEEKQKRLEAYKHIAEKEHKAADEAKSARTAATKAPAKPTGARGAMAAFKQMDAASPGPKPNEDDGGLVTVSLAKRAAHTMRRNAVAIKQEILRFVNMNTKDYENIEVTNFSSSWNDGMAFCALIHHFYPDSFDYSQLEPKNRRYNFELAFNTAEKMADISPLLDVEDMVKMKNPDWKCVFTYVQSFYRHLRDHDNNKAKQPAEA